VFSLATKEKRRYTLNTPSWAEALREASDVLRGLDPEIAASRAKAQGSYAPLTVRKAKHLWARFRAMPTDEVVDGKAIGPL
jgi:hypothetical protein